MKSPDAYIVLVKIKAEMEREYFDSKDRDDYKRMLTVQKMIDIVEKAMKENNPHENNLP